MITFADDPWLDHIAYIIKNKKTKLPDLPYTLYVFGANDNRPGLIYLSPYIPNADKVASFINARLGTCASTELIGNPSQRYWVAIHRKLREGDARLCSKICMFAERALHSLIIW